MFIRCQTTLTSIAIANLSVETSGVSALHLVALNGRKNHGCCQSNLTKIVQSEVDLLGRTLMGSAGNNLFGSVNSFVEAATRPSHCDAISQQIRTFIQMRTNLKVVDNSGAKRVMCIQSLRGKKGARLGDTIIGSVKEAQPRGKVKKGDVVYGVVVRAAMKKGRSDGSEVQFDDNAIVLVNNKGELIGTRVFGPVPHELRRKKHLKILALAEHIV
ncbi:hypothetical protein U9M48_037488 [Paspalum notatum var. saurae]|uniref:50S ribosomal protein L14, chloroplastic n=1 Tax=Paspalum notatum var. saurae TaxID=547442 RepID=A0AAQ3UH65_PASNO